MAGSPLLLFPRSLAANLPPRDLAPLKARAAPPVWKDAWGLGIPRSVSGSLLLTTPRVSVPANSRPGSAPVERRTVRAVLAVAAARRGRLGGAGRGGAGGRVR